MNESALATPPGGWPVPTSAYLHVPFCRHRCGYCNFSVVAGRDELADRFLAAIDRELATLDSPAIKTLFIGGGTPTHLSPEQLERLLKIVAHRFDLDSNVEWSVEANPEDIDDEKLDLLASHGVNRLSLGVQSFNTDKLAMLERGHSGDSAQETIQRTAQRIANLSIDLIFAAPGETLAVWHDDLQTALSLPIKHLSTYALTFEKGTAFWSRQRRGELSGPAEQIEVEMYDLIRQWTTNAGMEQYEVSNFSQADFRCQHNVAYWLGRGWYAAGPGAASFAGGSRKVNHRSATTYLRRLENDQSPIAEQEPITPMQYARERAAFGIRMMDGIDLDRLSRETGVDLACACGAAIERSIENGLVEQAGDRLCLTKRGVLFADTVAAVFL
ncbi:MAG: radical SAM family heme chaperone HemW [Pirellulaceae bacterium]|nr:radical SAM family heme chaperone HemW [Pirellulaceae bacterium]